MHPLYQMLRFILFVLLLRLRMSHAHDVRPIDQDKAPLRMVATEEVDSREVEEALTKLHFALLVESRQQEGESLNDTSIGGDLNRQKFAELVTKINDEANLLRSQALILSKAYQVLLVKYKDATKQLKNCSRSSNENDSTTQGNNVAFKSISEYGIESTSPCPILEGTSKRKPAACICNCRFPSTSPAGHSESNAVGNTYYYYNTYYTPESVGSSSNNGQPNVEPPYSFGLQPAAYPTPNEINDSDDPADAPIRNRPGSHSAYDALQDLEQHLDQKIERWKRTFFDRHERRRLEKLYTPEQIRSMFTQWQREQGHGKAAETFSDDGWQERGVSRNVLPNE
ncbi:uncharacterized protein LOC131437184 [Malaya genurostris]|uniref:uncharacterized protein LOC131437184 n=1 Tax=Malaya genurostris TaxID=325434 RepID=UPI0026F4003D|nr:uncharacterized protein LOC131437184 [Malaya genurostris]